MPKAILEFNLPEEQEEFEQATNATGAIRVLWELDGFLRTLIKYAPDEANQVEIDTYEKIRQELHRLLDENDVKL